MANKTTNTLLQWASFITIIALVVWLCYPTDFTFDVFAFIAVCLGSCYLHLAFQWVIQKLNGEDA